jgi:hypothetical protein
LILATPSRARRRRGVQLFGLVFLMALLGLTGVAVFRYSRQAGRQAVWFALSQQAYTLADTALKETLHALDENNGATGDFADLHQALTSGTGVGAPLAVMPTAPEAVTALRDRLEAEGYESTVTVELTATPPEPLWEGSLQGIPAVPGEGRGVIRLVARASVTHAQGLTVRREVRLERGYKIVQARPPLLGRFSLFADRRSVDPNGLEVDVVRGINEPVSERGSSRARGGQRPLVVRGEVQAPMVPAGTGALQLSRNALTTSGAPQDFLDQQGWVFLGGRNGPWELNLSHGYGEVGQSHLLASYKAPALFQDDEAADTALRTRLEGELRSTACVALAQGPAYGLQHILHGYAMDYELIGIDVRRRVRFVDPAGQVDGKSSLLRLWGTPDAVSPTLVFGPVRRRYMRKAYLGVQLTQCQQAGPQSMPVYFPEEFPPRARGIIERTFGSAEAIEEDGSAVALDEAFLQGLNDVLDDRLSGTLDAQGVLAIALQARDALQGPPTPRYTSQLVGELPREGFDEAAYDPLYQGQLSDPRVFTGNLQNGLAAFHAALSAKLTFQVSEEARDRVLRQQMLRPGPAGLTLSVPGVVYFPGGDVVLPPIAEVAEGGILVAQGNIVLQGDVLTGGDERLTLVSTEGDVVFEGGGPYAVEAYLVSTRGTVRLPDQGLTVTGGMAAMELALDDLRGQEVVVQYDPRYDARLPPGGPAPEELRIYYGEGGAAPKVAVVGGGSG